VRARIDSTIITTEEEGLRKVTDVNIVNTSGR